MKTSIEQRQEFGITDEEVRNLAREIYERVKERIEEKILYYQHCIEHLEVDKKYFNSTSIRYCSLDKLDREIEYFREHIRSLLEPTKDRDWLEAEDRLLKPFLVEASKTPETKLHEASSNGDVEKIKKLIEYGVDVNAKEGNNKYTPLALSCQHGNIEAVKLLLDNGADIEARDHYNETALCIASRNGRSDIVQLLLDNGADIESENLRGMTIIETICNAGIYSDTKKRIADILLNNGADVNHVSEHSTPLIEACISNDFELVSMLLNHGADPMKNSRNGRSPLDVAKKNSKILNLLKANIKK